MMPQTDLLHEGYEAIGLKSPSLERSLRWLIERTLKAERSGVVFAEMYFFF